LPFIPFKRIKPARNDKATEVNVFVSEASDFDCNTVPEYIPEEVQEISRIRGKYTVLNYLCLNIGCKCHITSMNTNLHFSVTSRLCK
jgi:hypothetical protein